MTSPNNLSAPAQPDNYDHLFDPSRQAPQSHAEEQAMIEAAAVRAPHMPQTEGQLVQELVRKQMAVSAADRANRDAAGLPPRTHDLR